jgi:ribokinase
VISVVGSVNIDFAVRVPHLPQPGETVQGEDARVGLGGKGANQAVAAARLGAEVQLLAAVGDDAFGHRALEWLRLERVRLERVKLSRRPTGVALIGVDRAGQNSILVSPGANAELSPRDLEQAFARSEWVITQLEIPDATWRRALATAKEAGCRVVVNASPVAAGLELAGFSQADWLVVNEVEAAQLLRAEPANEPRRALEYARRLAFSVANAVITLGGQGAVFAGPAGEGHVPGRRVQVTDTTGAGDTFSGALVVALSEGASPAEAVAFANAAAALATTRAGTTAAMPRRAEVERYRNGPL